MEAGMTVSLDDVRQAAAALAGALVRTPCLRSPTLSAMTGAEVYVKFENLQFTGSFKERGALWKLLGLDAEERRRGVVAMSAGNHAQGVAYHAQRLGVPATIVMPKGSPNVKIRQTRAFGAALELAGDTLDEAAAHAERVRQERGLVFVHPYDDPRIVAGQGTVGLEMLEDAPDLECLIVPVGGGGLISGIAVAARGLKPGVEIVGVETELYPSMRAALRGESAECGGQTLAEGIAVKAPGELTRRLIGELVDEVRLAPESQIERAIAVFLEIEKTVAEGAGAAGLAAMFADPARFRGRRVGLVLSGGNIDMRLLASLLMRGLVRDGRVARLRIEIADRPGALAAVAAIIAETQGNILEVLHQRMFSDVPAKLADLDVVVETRDRAHIQELIARMQDAGYPVRVLTDTADSGAVSISRRRARQ
jgi:threonine dehydratase